MDKKINWVTWLGMMFKEFLIESASRPQYEVVELYECQKTGFMKAVIKLGGRHTIEKNISEIIVDNNFVEGLDKKTIRTLTYMATVEKIKPDYSVVVQYLGNEVDDYILEIQSRKNKITFKKSLTEIVKDKILLSHFNPVDANRIGYLAGIRETVKDFQMKHEKR